MKLPLARLARHLERQTLEPVWAVYGDEPLLAMTWDYPLDEHGDPDPEAVLREINGYELTTDESGAQRPGRVLSGFGELKADGSTSCGCWIYSGVYGGDENKSARRVPHGGPGVTQSQWGWAWPADRPCPRRCRSRCRSSSAA